MAPSNALSMVQSEVSLMLTALKYSSRHSYRIHQDINRPLSAKFNQLKCILSEVNSIAELDSLVYLTPFLEVIRSEDTNEAVTGLALTAVDKFLSYGLLEMPPRCERTNGPCSLLSLAAAVEAIADASTQARFFGTDPRSAEVVLMKLLHLLQTLLLVPVGVLLSDRAVREILHSCFRICFEPKLSELLRRTAELSLASMIQLFFSRLPHLSGFKTENTTMNENSVVGEFNNRSIDSLTSSNGSHHKLVSTGHYDKLQLNVKADTSKQAKQSQLDVSPMLGLTGISGLINSEQQSMPNVVSAAHTPQDEGNASTINKYENRTQLSEPENNETGGRYYPNPNSIATDPESSTTHRPSFKPYGIAAVYDLLSYLINSLAPTNNSETVILTALGLITIALETGADTISSSPKLLQLIQNELTKHLILLLYSEGVWQFAATLRVGFLLFESMRGHLKLQMEVYLQRLTAIGSSDNELTGYDRREIALDSVVRLFLIPGLATELYVNYDCDPYCSNLFEDITKMLAKNAFPVDRLMSTHLLALDALSALLNAIGIQCNADTVNRLCQRDKLPFNRHPVYSDHLPTREQLNEAKTMKKILMLGSDMFNTKPARGIEFLQQHNILQSPLDHNELTSFLRVNPRLDKRMIGEYISKRGNANILSAFVKQFNFASVQIDEALRTYLEAFRLPGEAPVIQHIMEHFAEHWRKSNNEPFANTDAAFTLAYAILMLNTDQHNPNSKKQNVPMRLEDFKKNLNGMNGGENFDPSLLESIFTNIRNNEIVMPFEQTGLVRENYLWKCLLSRSSSPTGCKPFIHVQTGTLDADLFELIWGPTVSALSFIFDKTSDIEVQTKAIDGFNRCACIAAYYGMSDVLDNLVISLCKFTTLLSSVDNPVIVPIQLGRNGKACLALRLVFVIASKQGDILRYGWHSLIECILQLFRANLIQTDLLEAVDFICASKRVLVTNQGCIPVVLPSRPDRKPGRCQKSDSLFRDLGVFGSFYQYLTANSSWLTSSQNDSADESVTDANDQVDKHITTLHATHTVHNPTGADNDVGDDDDYEVVIDPITICQTDVDSSKVHKGVNPSNSSLSSSTTDGKLSCKGTNGAVNHKSTVDYMNQQNFISLLNRAQLDDATAARFATDTVTQCHIEQFIEDSKFLVDASLNELIKALLYVIRGDSCCSVLTEEFDIDSTLLRIQHDTATHLLSMEQFTSHPSVNATSEKSLPSAHQTLESTTNVQSDTITPPNHSLSTLLTNSNIGSSVGLGPSEPVTSEECRIFCLELLIRILVRNRDRVNEFWPLVRQYLLDFMITTPVHSRNHLLTERVVVGFLHLAISLIHRNVMTSQIFKCLYWLLLTHGELLLYSPNNLIMNIDSSKLQNQHHHQLTNHRNWSTRRANQSEHPKCPVSRIGQQILNSLIDLLKNHAADLPDPTTDWKLIFGLLELCGAGRRIYSLLLIQAHSLNKRTTFYSSSETINKHHTSPASDDDDEQTGVVGCGYTSDSEAQQRKSHSKFINNTSAHIHCTKSVHLSQPNISLFETQYPPLTEDIKSTVTTNLLTYPVFIGSRDAVTLELAIECLAFVVRDPAHITPDNLECCVRTLRVFVEACLLKPTKQFGSTFRALTTSTTAARSKHDFAPENVSSFLESSVDSSLQQPNLQHCSTVPDMDVISNPKRSDQRQPHEQQTMATLTMMIERNRANMETALCTTTSVAISQLLDLINILFNRVTSIYTEWTRLIVNSDAHDADTTQHLDMALVWSNSWCPLLQCMARACSDKRREVRTDALTCLQRALLSQVLQSLDGPQWEDCFDKVLFPLMSTFLESIAIEEAMVANAQIRPRSPYGGRNFSALVEFADPRMRAIPLLTKVFLQHLRPLYTLSTFNALWIKMLTYIEHYMLASSSDSLTDAVRESLKNVLLVMFTGTHDIYPILVKNADVNSTAAKFWCLTEQRLSTFVPELLEQLFPPPQPTPSPSPLPQLSTPTLETPVDNVYN